MDITNVLRSHGIGKGKRKAYTQQLLEIAENPWVYTPTTGATYINTLLTKEENVVTATRTGGSSNFIDCVEGKTGIRLWLVEIPSPQVVQEIALGLDGFVYALHKDNLSASNLKVTKVHPLTGTRTDITLPNSGNQNSKSLAVDANGAIYVQWRDTYHQVTKYTVSGTTITRAWNHNSDISGSNAIWIFMLLPDVNAVIFSPSARAVVLDMSTGGVVYSNATPSFGLYTGLKAPGTGNFYALHGGGISLMNVTRGTTPTVTQKISRVANFGGIIDTLTPNGALSLVNNGEFLYVARGDYGIKLNPTTLDILSVFYCPNAKLVNSKAEFFARENRSVGETWKYLYYSKIR